MSAKLPAISAPNPGKNRQLLLKQIVPNEELIGPQHFELVEREIPETSDGQILVRTLYLGTSPAQRSYVTDGFSMHVKVSPGSVMRGRGVAVVIESKCDRFETGDIVVATTGWQDFSVHDTDTTGLAAVIKLKSPLKPYSLSLSVLGSAGYTAYFGLIDVARASQGDTVLISAAAGGVGSCAVQIAKAMGCNVIGIAGGTNKCHWLKNTFGIQQCIDYKSEDLDSRLSELCPDGIDVFFDNVGGSQLDTALLHLKLGARVAICGYIATDYHDYWLGPKNYVRLLAKRATMHGFFVFDYQDRFDEAETQLKRWYEQGQLIDNSDLMYGLEEMPMAVQSLFTGTNTGVRLCQISEEP